MPPSADVPVPASAHPLPALAAVAVAGALAAGCGDVGGASGGRALETVRDTVGDTVVVRTIAGSVWGDTADLVPEVRIGVMDGPEEYILGRVTSVAVDDRGRIFVVDRQVPALRVYDAEGRYLRTWGREGGGPGEYARPSAVAALSDGRVLLRDPGNARIQVYDPDGVPAGTWPIRGQFFTSRPLYVDTADHAYYSLLLDPEAELGEWRTGLVRIRPDGVPGDTLSPPDAGYEAPYVEARRENSISRSGVPFSPGESWSYSPLGYFVHGVSTRYALDLRRPDAPVLRIEKAYDPVAVRQEEAAARKDRIVRNFRENYGSWTWNGPEIPGEKPPYRSFFVGAEGRIWVAVSRPGIERENPAYDPADDGAEPTVWSEPVALDVFAPDGRFLGHVRAPEGLSLSPRPFVRGERVWAVVEDELGVETVVRFRIERPGERATE